MSVPSSSIARSPLASSIQRRLRERGLRATLVRMSVMRIAETFSRPFTVEEMHRELLAADLAVSLGTVYHVMAGFDAAGLFIRHWIPGLGTAKGAYSLAFPQDVPQSTAHRITCTRCGAGHEFDDLTLLQKLRDVTGQSDLQASQAVLYMQVHGCKDCQHSSRVTARARTRARRGVPRPEVADAATMRQHPGSRRR